MELFPLILAMKLLTVGSILIHEMSCANFACNNDGQVRLIGGVQRLEGRLEVCRDGEWGTICNDGWDMNDALVVCRELGVEDGGKDVLVNNVMFGKGDPSQVVHFKGAKCNGTEKRLLECHNSGLHQHDCTHEEDVGIICDVPFQECNNGDVRLEDGTTRVKGRVEICAGGRWGTVCNYNWDDLDAAVVCRQLGLNTFNPQAMHIRAQGSATSTPVVFDNVHCSGQEAKLTDCWRQEFVEFCFQHSYAGVDCTHVIECTDAEIRLVDGENKFEGRIEYCQDGHWSMVCRDEWDEADARVVCRQLGYNLDVIALSSYFGLGSSSKVTTYLNQVHCSGNESNLSECSRVEGFETVTCLRPGAGVVCPIPASQNSLSLSPKEVSGGTTTTTTLSLKLSLIVILCLTIILF